jgi:hypothetical protein
MLYLRQQLERKIKTNNKESRVDRVAQVVERLLSKPEAQNSNSSRIKPRCQVGI